MLKQPIEVNRKGRCDLFYLNKKKVQWVFIFVATLLPTKCQGHFYTNIFFYTCKIYKIRIQFTKRYTNRLE